MDKTIAVIGAGLIGRAWAMVLAQAGWNAADGFDKTVRDGLGLRWSRPGKREPDGAIAA